MAASRSASAREDGKSGLDMATGLFGWILGLPRGSIGATVTLKVLTRNDQHLARISELEAELARERRIGRALREVGLALGTTLDLDSLLELILSKLTDLLDADRATLYLLDEKRGELVSRIAVGGAIRSIHVPIGQGIAGLVARDGQALRVNEAYRDERFDRDYDRLTGYLTRSILAAPMKNHVGRTLGVVQVLNKSTGGFTEDDEEILSALATQAAISIDHSRLFISQLEKNKQLVDTKEQLERRVRDLHLLFELESSMARASSQNELLSSVLGEAIRICEAETGAMLLAEDGSGDLLLHYFDPSMDEALRVVRMKSGEGFTGWAMQEGELLMAHDVAKDPRVSKRAIEELGLDLFSALVVPLEGQDGRPIGAMGIYNKRENRHFEQEDLEFVRLIAANASTAIQLFRSRIAREREERLSTIGRLLSSVIHDLKTPMTVISGFVQMMTIAKTDEKRKEYAELVLKQFDLIAAMQREVLEFARGERTVLVRRVYLSQFFGELLEQLEREAAGKGVQVSLDLQDKGVARFDESKLTRAVHNLARNAIEAMGERGGELTIRVKRASEPGPSGLPDLLIEVADTGPGIPKEIEGQIFQSFVTGGKKDGTGLGLAIVKKIAVEHGGRISVESSERGASFTIHLPQSERNQ